LLNSVSQQVRALRTAFSALARLKIREFGSDLPASEVLETTLEIEQNMHSQLMAQRNAAERSREEFETTHQAAQENIRTLQSANNRLNASLRAERELTDTFRSEFQASRRRADEILQSTQILEDSLLARITAIEMEYTS
jgi:chromosome segregation ATPase